MAERDFDFTGGGRRTVHITNHARDRWVERLGRDTRRMHPLAPGTWHVAEPVYAPTANCDESRLYTIPGDRDMLLCGKYGAGSVRVVTVMYADYDRLSQF